MNELELKSLIKSYRGKRVVDDVSLNVREGEVVGLLGPNGAGKTTTFYMTVGLVKPDQGKIFLNGNDIGKLPMFQRARRGIGYLTQEPSIFRKLTVEENIKAVLETLPITSNEINYKLTAVLDERGIKRGADQKAFLLSGGERRRVEIARTLICSPYFILLDEPFAGIDPLAVEDIKGIVGHLKDRGIGVLITDHNVRDILEITDRAYIINEGKIFASGTPDELAASEEVRRSYLGERFQLIQSADTITADHAQVDCDATHTEAR